MDWEREFSEFSVDAVEQQLISDERLIGQLRARQLHNLEVLDACQVFTAAVAHNLSEWLAARADISLASARSVVRTMRRTQSKPWLREALAAGAISFDRAGALSKVDNSKDLFEHLDIAGVNRASADQVEITHEDEVRAVEDRYLVLQPSLDKSWWNLYGGLDAVAGAAIDAVLQSNADTLPELPDGTVPGVGWRKATALLELATGGSTPKAQITVFVDGDRSVETDGRTGMRLLTGPRVGPHALQAILCGSHSELIVNTADGVPLRYVRNTRTTPPALNRTVLAQTGGYCAADGCDSRYRVEAHHIIPWSQEAKQIRRTWFGSAGSTTTSSSTNEVSTCTDTRTTAGSDSENQSSPVL
ncbi:MAG TPA: hypothetical protein VIW94_01875 [Acidimicrobiia bacterium]